MCVCVLGFLTAAIIVTTVVVSTQDVTITSTKSNRPLSVCPGEEVNFTCVTRGSLIIAWLSDEYIGAGGTRVEFAAVDVGKSQEINPNTVAILVSAEVINGTRILTSQLMVTAMSEYLNPSVTCLHVGHLINMTISFVVSGT